MGGDRIPGPLSDLTDPLEDQQPPGAGFGLPGVVGLDGGSAPPATGGPHLTGWPRQITWDGFPAVSSRPAGVDEDAQIHAEVVNPENVSATREDGRWRLSAFTVRIRIIRDDSWVVTSQKTANLLAHEQGHFDITGLMGRDCAADLAALRARSADELQGEVNRILAHYRQWAQRLNDQYDDETNHSRNREAQQRWEGRIRAAAQNNTRLAPMP